MMWADIMHSQYMMQPKPIKALLQLIIVISVVTITVLHCTRYFISVAIIPNYCTILDVCVAFFWPKAVEFLCWSTSREEYLVMV